MELRFDRENIEQLEKAELLKLSFMEGYKYGSQDALNGVFLDHKSLAEDFVSSVLEDRYSHYGRKPRLVK